MAALSTTPIVCPDVICDRSRLAEFLELPQFGRIQALYVWIGGSGLDIRSKTRTLEKVPAGPDDLPIWNFDGSSTGQAPGHASEVLLKPRAIFRDPFRRGDNIVVLCDCYKPDMTPVPSNTRAPCAEAMEKVKEHVPWFGIEQEYTMFTLDGRPLGFPKGGVPRPQGPYYCGNGVENAYGRDLVEAHYRACLYAGVTISGTNAEVMAGQWEYQVGPCEGIDMGDHLWISRWILLRIGEIFGIVISFDPKPMKGDWNGAGCHTNYSTKSMREEGGLKHILQAVTKLGKRHDEHIRVYGEGNEQRLTGQHETASIDEFTYGVGNRGASVRIPTQAEKDGCGYFEDRRPASNICPYRVTGKIVETTLLWNGKD